MTAIEQLAIDFNPLLNYFLAYWETTKIFLSNTFNYQVCNSKQKISRVYYKYKQTTVLIRSLARHVGTDNKIAIRSSYHAWKSCTD